MRDHQPFSELGTNALAAQYPLIWRISGLLQQVPDGSNCVWRVQGRLLQHTPPQSYINVDDFRSIEELADYLIYLDRNDTAYAAFFAWRQFGELVVSS